MRKKVLYFITKSNWGGAQKQVFDLATALDKDKFDVAVTCGGEGILVDRLKEADIQVLPIKGLGRDVSLIKDLKSFISFIQILKSERPDIIHLHSTKAGAMGSFIGRILGVPKIIFTVHGWPFKEDKNVFWRLMVWVASFFTILFSHKTIVVSNDDLMRTPAPLRKRVTTIQNGIGEIEFLSKKDARSILSEGIDSKIDNEDVWVGTISELHKNKGLEYSIRAIKKLIGKGVNTIFVIIGEGELRVELNNLIEKLSLGDSVFLIGHVENAPEYLKALDVFTLTSLKEGLPYTILEAGARGLPVVASDVGGIPEIITDKKSGILTPAKDEKAIAKALDSLIKNEDVRKDLGEELKKKVAKKFSLEDMREKIFALY